MRAAIVTVVALMVLNVAIILGTATGTGRALPLALGLGTAVVLAGVLWCGVWAFRKVRKAGSGARARTYGSVQRVQVWRVVVLVGVAVICEGLVVWLAPHRKPLVGEALYYVVLLCVGVALARWAGSGGAAPIWAATGILIVLAVVEAAQFVTDPGNRWQLGPEITLFMLWGYVGRLNMLPLDATVAWCGWRLTIKRGAA